MTFQTTFQLSEPKGEPLKQQPNAGLVVKTASSVDDLKKCFKCEIEKPRDQFYKHSKMADGLLGKCKDCTKRDVAANIDVNKTNPEWLKKERARCRDKSNRRRALGLEKDYPRSPKRWAQNNPEKRKAQAIANYALQRGKIKTETKCTICGSSEDLEKHHPDYSKPLYIQWLCVKCHGLTRRKD